MVKGCGKMRIKDPSTIRWNRNSRRKTMNRYKIQEELDQIHPDLIQCPHCNLRFWRYPDGKTLKEI